MSTISLNIENVKADLHSGVELVAVSKTKPTEDIREAYAAGQRVFGENKVQELVEKNEVLIDLEGIEWHMIGHLQSNKVKYIAPFVSLIHGVDKFKLLKEIQKQGLKSDRVIDCLLQIHIAEEETKFGLSKEEVQEILASIEFSEMNHLRVVGLMGMATHTEDESQIRNEFKGLKILFDELAEKSLPANAEMIILSMGMSGDYLLAQEEGSTMVRVGSKIFGSRNYH
jgi:pyridoxal phosphate enzyme (YggS family)